MEPGGRTRSSPVPVSVVTSTHFGCDASADPTSPPLPKRASPPEPHPPVHQSRRCITRSPDPACVRRRGTSWLLDPTMAGPGPYTILLVRLTFKTSPFFNTVGSDRAKLARSRMLQFTDRIGATSASAEALILTPAATGMAKCALELPSACGSPCSFYGDGAASQDKHANRGFGRSGRARHLPQRRERLLRPPYQRQ